MRSQTGLIRAFSACFAVVGLVTSSGAAENVETLVCGANQSFDCGQDSTCIEDDAEAIGLPSVLHVDLKSNQVVGTMPDGTDLKADFTGEVQKDGRIVLTGIQAGLGWTMTVAQATGAMTLTISGDDNGFVVFGSCAPH
jgi:hypothetical protein